VSDLPRAVAPGLGKPTADETWLGGSHPATRGAAGRLSPARHARNVALIAQLTFLEAYRRWVLWAVALLGSAFVALFAIGFFFIHREVTQQSRVGEVVEVSDFILLAGLYAAYFLVVVLALLTSIDTISGEIASGRIHTVVTKPVGRGDIVAGKWLGFAAMLTVFAAVLCGSIIGVVWLIADYLPPSPVQGVALIILAGLVVLSLSILGGTRLTTLTNGIAVFMLYGLAFIGGWIEQFGAFLQNQTAVNIGIVISLLMPAEAMWKRAAYEMQPASMRLLVIHPMAAVTSPSNVMVAYTVLYVAVAVAAAVVLFRRRDL